MSTDELFDQDSLEWLQSREFPYRPNSGPFMAGMAVDVADAKVRGAVANLGLLRGALCSHETGDGLSLPEQGFFSLDSITAVEQVHWGVEIGTRD